MKFQLHNSPMTFIFTKNSTQTNFQPVVALERLNFEKFEPKSIPKITLPSTRSVTPLTIKSPVGGTSLDSDESLSQESNNSQAISSSSSEGYRSPSRSPPSKKKLVLRNLLDAIPDSDEDMFSDSSSHTAVDNANKNTRPKILKDITIKNITPREFQWRATPPAHSYENPLDNVQSDDDIVVNEANKNTGSRRMNDEEDRHNQEPNQNGEEIDQDADPFMVPFPFIDDEQEWESCDSEDLEIEKLKKRPINYSQYSPRRELPVQNLALCKDFLDTDNRYKNMTPHKKDEFMLNASLKFTRTNRDKRTRTEIAIEVKRKIIENRKKLRNEKTKKT
ncbi:hypothetical protein TKK_0013064 [Trichogramma kaykai]